jgi:hypothetical protein
MCSVYYCAALCTLVSYTAAVCDYMYLYSAVAMRKVLTRKSSVRLHVDTNTKYTSCYTAVTADRWYGFVAQDAAAAEKKKSAASTTVDKTVDTQPLTAVETTD